MKKKKLRLLRVSCEVLFFILIFLSFFRLFPQSLKVISIKSQISPDAISFFYEGFLISLFLLVLSLLIALIFGRIYCSFFCPLGGFQDILIRIKKRRKFSYKKPLILIKTTILILAVISLISGSLYIISYLDPYSIFGRAVNYLLKPFIALINNGGELFLRKVNIYALRIMEFPTFNPLNLAPFILILGTIIYFSIKRGRLYCNSICPLGTMLGILSTRSLFEIEIDKESCTGCGICESVCKAECINSKDKTVDNSSCIRCFNCLNVCPISALSYKPAIKREKSSAAKKQNISRRNFLYSFLGILGFSGVNLFLRGKKIPANYTPPPTPPGSISLDKYISKCTACYLCVNNCPTNVLQPSLFHYGIKGVFIPYMDFYSGYCSYECTRCLEVCPTDAITPHTVEEKKKIQIGRVKFIKENCVVYRNNTNCGACGEICPTAAVTMIPYKGTLSIPKTQPSICIGCGACQNVCPASPEKAIVVETNILHREAKIPERKSRRKQGKTTEDFPF